MRLVSMLRTYGSVIGVALLALTAIYLLLVVLPFYGNGVHLRSYGEIAGSHVDFKGYAPFVWPLARIPATALAWVGALLTPVLSLLLAPLLLTSVWLTRESVRRGYRMLWAGTVAVNVASLALTWQSLGLIRLWLGD